MKIVPTSLRQANEFVTANHRHNRAVRGHKFSIGLEHGGDLVGVVICGRPVSRHLDNGTTLEVNRACIVDAKNGNSMLYGAAVRAGKALGYTKFVTYTRKDESGVSLRAANWTRVAELPPRENWEASSVKLRDIRNENDPGGIARVRWERT